MKEDGLSVAVKSLATGAAAAFGLTWWAVVAALIGAAASYHFEPEQQPGTVRRLIVGILVLAFSAALLASAMPHVPGFGWAGNVLIEVRAGLLGVFANPIIKWVRRQIESRHKPQGG